MSAGATTKQVEISAGTTLVLQRWFAHDGSVWIQLESAIVERRQRIWTRKGGVGASRIRKIESSDVHHINVERYAYDDHLHVCRLWPRTL